MPNNKEVAFMYKCELCGSHDIIRVTLEDSDETIAICRECEALYEVDENLNPVFGHDGNDKEYFTKLQNIFKNWDNVKEKISYKLNKQ